MDACDLQGVAGSWWDVAFVAGAPSGWMWLVALWSGGQGLVPSVRRELSRASGGFWGGQGWGPSLQLFCRRVDGAFLAEVWLLFGWSVGAKAGD